MAIRSTSGSNYLTIPAVNAPIGLASGGDGFTCMVWYLPSQTTVADAGIFGASDSPASGLTDGWYVEHEANTLAVNAKNAGTAFGFTQLSDSTTMLAGRWVHVTWQEFPLAGGGYGARLWTNGLLRFNQNSGNTPSSTSRQLNVGIADADVMNGSLAHLRYWNRLLNGGEIVQAMRASNVPPHLQGGLTIAMSLADLKTGIINTARSGAGGSKATIVGSPTSAACAPVADVVQPFRVFLYSGSVAAAAFMPPAPMVIGQSVVTASYW